MPRRSSRQQQAGYYGDDGTPTVSYKETTRSTVFRRRKNQRRDRHNSGHHSQSQDVSEIIQSDTTDDLYNRISKVNVPVLGHYVLAISCSLLLLPLFYAIADIKLQLREAQQELWSFKQRMDMFAPLADTIPNFAMESQGARIHKHLSSDTYCPFEVTGLISTMFCWKFGINNQHRVIQGHSSLRPGDCWCFSGDRGHLFISLSHHISITHVTLGHISVGQSPTGSIASAPRDFSIYGVKTMGDGGTFLGTLKYDQNGAVFQTFQLNNPDESVFEYVRLQVENNWGNSHHTCLYSFRVHGKLPSGHHFN